ncbi:MAG TPA: MBL fold metallo-hydrolase [Motilibacteraceae bacterium]|nr:MBL fold metallo-hydrolase [Motilibacteraceae bacterium]
MRELVEVADGVFVASSRRDLTTSTLVVHGSEVLLVDPAWDPDELEALADLLEHRGWQVVAGLATHAHHDHLLWHPRFGAAPRLASARTCELAEQHRDDLVGNLGADWPAELATLVGRVEPAPDALPFPELVELVEHDGHAPGHTAVWLPERGVLLAGDMLSDVELPLPLWPDDLPAYLAGLERLRPHVATARVLVPGHGNPTDDPMSRLAADRRYLDDLRRTGRSDDPRQHNPAMPEVHEAVTRLVRDTYGS